MGDYHTCANSRPQLGLGMASVYSCPHVSYKDGKLKSIEQCLNCRSYSDVRTSVDISCDTFRAKIYMNRLSDLTVRKASKLFRMIWKHESENGRAIDELGKYLASMFIKHNHELMGRIGKKWSKLYQLWRTEEQKRRPRR